MKMIQLSNFNSMMIDDEDLNFVIKYTWHQCNGYAGRVIKGTTMIVYLHRELLNAPPDFQVDHMDGNKLNNQRRNLRLVTKAQNLQNAFRKDNTSGFKGVSLNSRGTKWRARVGKEEIGLFDNKEDAARAYDKRALEVYGEGARLNFPFEQTSKEIYLPEALPGVLPRGDG